MRSFFLKTYLTVIAFSIVMFLLIVFVILRPLFLKTDWKDFKQELVVDHQLLMLKLDQAPPTSWSKAVSEYQPVFGMVPSLINRETLSPEEMAALTGDGPQSLLSPYSEAIWYGLFSLPDSDTILKITEDGSPLTDLNGTDLFWLLMPLILLTISLAFGAILIIHSISKPIRQLSHNVEAFGHGHYQQRIKSAKPPVEGLAQSFNAMADEIEAKIHEQQLLVGAIPHELRTPLSRIRFALDISRDKTNLKELRQQIETIDLHVDDLESIVDNILELTRMIGRQLVTAPIPISTVLQSASDSFIESPTQITVRCSADLTATGHAGLIQQAINNLVQNALLFANTSVVLHAFTDQDTIVVRVEDDGPGVAPEKLKEIFLPFSKLDKSRNLQTGGLGLGLALVKLIMEQHQGTVTAANSHPHGLRLELRWPLQEAINDSTS